MNRASDTDKAAAVGNRLIVLGRSGHGGQDLKKTKIPPDCGWRYRDRSYSNTAVAAIYTYSTSISRPSSSLYWRSRGARCPSPKGIAQHIQPILLHPTT